MEFQLKDGWDSYLGSGFFLGMFLASLFVMYVFDSIPGFPINLYLIAMFMSFVVFISLFGMGSYKPANTSKPANVNKPASTNNSPSPDFKKGYDMARDTFQFSVPCYVCGRPVVISDKSNISTAAKSKLEVLKIHHKECQPKVKA